MFVFICIMMIVISIYFMSVKTSGRNNKMFVFISVMMIVVSIYFMSVKPSIPPEYRDIILKMKQEADENGKVQLIVLDKKRSKYVKAKAAAEGVNMAEYIDSLIDSDIAYNGEK